ncbi:MAG: ATP-binding protein [Actinomycetia bacterium]|nr:ATP-binding protein [Actinomycetes bacterium]
MSDENVAQDELIKSRGLYVTRLRDRVRVEVHGTASNGLLRPGEPDEWSTSGRGRWLVETLASTWGLSHENRTTVWFEVALKPQEG